MTELAQSVFDPSELIPFNGYRNFSQPDEPIFDLIPSLTHFYESEKFRGTAEGLRVAMLDARTAREAGKIAKKNQTLWRSDWKKVRGNVFRAGLAMQVLQSKHAMDSARQGFSQSIELGSQKRVGGLPGAFVAHELQRFFDKPAKGGRLLLGAIALNGCVPDDIWARLDALFVADKPLSAAIYAGKDSNNKIELWCAFNGVPVRLTSQNSSRLREEDAPDVTSRVTTLVTCMPGTRKGPIAILKSAAAKKPKIRVLDFGISAKKLAIA